MSLDITALYALRDMLDKATGSSRELDASMAFALGVFDCKLSYGLEDCKIVRGDETTDDHVTVIVRRQDCSAGGLLYCESYVRYTSSIDAVEALRQKFFPTPAWLVRSQSTYGGNWQATLERVTLGELRVGVYAEAPTECLARLKATVAALIAQEENENDQA